MNATFALVKSSPAPRTVVLVRSVLVAAFNNNDGAALAALYAEDAVLVNDSGPIYGREAIEKYYVDLFKQVHFSNQVAKPGSPHIIGKTGNEVWWNGEWSNTIKGDNWGPIDHKDILQYCCS